jgi:predicted ATP-dependent endonuclease of OLD family
VDFPVWVVGTNLGLSNKNLTRIRSEMQELLAKKPNDTRLITMFNSLLASRIPSYFINIVEEPEQNLLPDTQIRMLFSLLSYRNLNEKNKLIVTTHSPYGKYFNEVNNILYYIYL